MSIYKQEKYGFVYIWRDRKHNRYYIGCHWGHTDDGYICSSPWMRQAFKHRPQDFKRRILTNNIPNRKETYEKEQQWLNLIKECEISPIAQKPRYYNLKIKNNEVWHKYDENIKSVGEKISKANKGKKFGPCPPEKAQNISKAKKEKFAQKEAELGYKFDPEHAAKLSEGRKGKPHTEEWKQENSKRMHEQWSNGTRKRAEPRQKMTAEEQAELSSIRLKTNWSDPEWKEKQKLALSKGAQNRPPRSEESKRKASETQKGKPKLSNRATYLITFSTGEQIQYTGLKEFCQLYSVSISSVGGALREKRGLPKYGIEKIIKV